MWPYLFAMILLAVGLYGAVAKKNIIKIVVALMIMEYAANLFLVLLSYRVGPHGEPAIAPIMTPGNSATFAQQAADPLPQAMILTSIVIGLGVAGLVVGLAVRLYDKYGTFDITRIRNLRG
jgi:multicomponent Na+:H+ antiporter subunit C